MGKTCFIIRKSKLSKVQILAIYNHNFNWTIRGMVPKWVIIESSLYIAAITYVYHINMVSFMQKIGITDNNIYWNDHDLMEVVIANKQSPDYANDAVNLTLPS
jgi:hypothetical protein